MPITLQELKKANSEKKQKLVIIDGFEFEIRLMTMPEYLEHCEWAKSQDEESATGSATLASRLIQKCCPIFANDDPMQVLTPKQLIELSLACSDLNGLRVEDEKTLAKN